MKPGPHARGKPNFEPFDIALSDPIREIKLADQICTAVIRWDKQYPDPELGREAAAALDAAIAAFRRHLPGRWSLHTETRSGAPTRSGRCKPSKTEVLARTLPPADRAGRALVCTPAAPLAAHAQLLESYGAIALTAALAREGGLPAARLWFLTRGAVALAAAVWRPVRFYRHEKKVAGVEVLALAAQRTRNGTDCGTDLLERLEDCVRCDGRFDFLAARARVGDHLGGSAAVACLGIAPAGGPALWLRVRLPEEVRRGVDSFCTTPGYRERVAFSSDVLASGVLRGGDGALFLKRGLRLRVPGNCGCPGLAGW